MFGQPHPLLRMQNPRVQAQRTGEVEKWRETKASPEFEFSICLALNGPSAGCEYQQRAVARQGGGSLAEGGASGGFPGEKSKKLTESKLLPSLSPHLQKADSPGPAYLSFSRTTPASLWCVFRKDIWPRGSISLMFWTCLPHTGHCAQHSVASSLGSQRDCGQG